MEKRNIVWKSQIIGFVHAYDISDWKGKEPPSAKDFWRINVLQAREALHRALERFPHCPVREEIDADKPWVQSILEEVCITLLKEKDRSFEEKVIINYIDHYGMDQILEIFGISPEDVKNKIQSEAENMPG